MNHAIASDIPPTRPAGYAHVITDRACPVCDAPLLRIHRRTRDRIVSLFSPVHRYRCLGFSCCWEGTLRADDSNRAAIALSRADFIYRTQHEITVPRSAASGVRA